MIASAPILIAQGSFRLHDTGVSSISTYT